MIHNPWFYAVGAFAVLMTGVSKGGFAGGIGLLAVPLMALIINPVQAAGIMLPILVAMDVFGVIAYRKTFDKRNLLMLLPGSVVGVGIGALTSGLVSEHYVKLVVGIITVAFALYWYTPKSDKPAKRGWLSGTLCGTGAGFTSFVSHAGTPPFQMHMLPQRLDKTIYVGTSVMFFASLNAMKTLPYALLGQLNTGNLKTSAVLIPLAPIGMMLGIWLHNIIPEKPFYRVCYAMVLVVGIKLLWDAIAGLT
ncbi:MAG TPA: sulfite exporter TauE/SafE family protein [Alphaproteobacteria bacterium]|nr:sulfite exporter TauE/SafE family protein [Alphaproteobacteria bacterium]